jgi:hypothetical protein
VKLSGKGAGNLFGLGTLPYENHAQAFARGTLFVERTLQIGGANTAGSQQDLTEQTRCGHHLPSSRWM